MEDDIDIYEDLPSFETKPNENVRIYYEIQVCFIICD